MKSWQMVSPGVRVSGTGSKRQQLHDMKNEKGIKSPEVATKGVERVITLWHFLNQ
jgi:hypothetical protein